jgi:hypothetical protein
MRGDGVAWSGTRWLLGAALAVAMLAFPASSPAAQTIGLSFTPTSNCVSGGHTYYGQKSTAPDPYVVPSNGVITSWTFQTGSVGFALVKLKVGTSVTSRTIRTDAESAAVSLPASSSTTTAVRIPVVAGQRIGFYAEATAPCHSAGPGMVDDSLMANTQPFDQTPGMSEQYLELGSWAFPLSARIEPDSDGDGYGDETQDACPTSPGPGPCPAPAGPTAGGAAGGAANAGTGRLQLLAIAPKSFTAANVGGAVISSGKGDGPVGANVSFVLSAPATVTFTVSRVARGRKVGRHCVKPTKANAGNAKCLALQPLKGSFSAAGVAGANRLKFAGRISGRALTPGSYALIGSAGGTSKQATFRIAG